MTLLWCHQGGVEILDTTSKLNLLTPGKVYAKFDTLSTKSTIFPLTTLLILEGQQNPEMKYKKTTTTATKKTLKSKQSTCDLT